MSNPVIRTRIAPSPTGELHIGTLRTLLYDYALARQNNGQFIIRIEDTDQKRFVPGSQERLLQVIKDFGINWDEGPDIGGPYGPYVQTQRLDIYQKYIQQLIDKGHAYYCFCTQERLNSLRDTQRAAKQLPRYDQHCLKLTSEEIKKNLDNGMPYTIRMRMPDNEVIIFEDGIRGKIRFNTKDSDDQVLIKSNGIPTYHFAVVIDDYLMKISHVFRGEEWLPSTPKQILLYRFFGWDMPKYYHLTVLLDPSGKGKMSKRHGSSHARAFLDDGYLPEAIINFLVLLGWNPKTEREFFSLEDFVKEFSLENLHKKAPAFDRKKLDFLNGYYIRLKSNEELFPYFQKFLPLASENTVKQLIPILKERLVKFSDLTEQTKFLFEDVDFPKELLFLKVTDENLISEILTKTKDFLQKTEFKFEIIQPALIELIKQNNWNTGQFFMIFRVAICGTQYTPPVVDCLPILGKDKTINKISIALKKLES